VGEVRECIQLDAAATGLPDDGKPLRDGGTGAMAYAEAVGVYLAFAISRIADYNSSIATWKPSGEQVMQTYKRQALPMTWDFPESNVMGQSAICWNNAVKYTADNLAVTAGQHFTMAGYSEQHDASQQSLSLSKIVSTDPPYYDNISYADLSDFFYVWLRRSLRSIFPNLFATLAVPKAEELVATPYRHGSKEHAEIFFLDGMTRAMHRLADQAHPAFPVTIYYAFKQSENKRAASTASTGWETFLDAVIRAGFAVSGTWPMRTELRNRIIGMGTNALASSIVLVCRKRAADAPIATRREFVTALKGEMPVALAHLQHGYIAPVDLAQSSIGPGMAIFTRYAKVLEADGSAMSVRSALQLIHQVTDEVRGEEEGDLDQDTRFAVTWFETHGFQEGPYGEAETLATARAVSVSGVRDAGILKSVAGKVRLHSRAELPEDWDPVADDRPTIWEATQHLIKRLDEEGEQAAAALLAKLGSAAEQARNLAYRLYTTCDRRGWAEEAQAYNGLVIARPELEKLASEITTTTPAQQTGLFD
jgi:putative DNA methylase